MTYAWRKQVKQEFAVPDDQDFIDRSKMNKNLLCSTHKCYAYVCNQSLWVLSLLQQVLSSGPHPHLFDDLLVQTGSLVLQFAASSLGEGVTTLTKEDCKNKLSAQDTVSYNGGERKHNLLQQKGDDYGWCVMHSMNLKLNGLNKIQSFKLFVILFIFQGPIL